MDKTDRTCSTPFEIPDDALRILRRAADYGFERIGDPMGSWDESGNARARLLNAARMVDLFSFGNPEAHHVAELADAALRWAERPDSMPKTIEELGEHFSRLGELRALINLRDNALRHTGRPLPDGASGEVGA